MQSITFSCDFMQYQSVREDRTTRWRYVICKTLLNNFSRLKQDVNFSEITQFHMVNLYLKLYLNLRCQIIYSFYIMKTKTLMLSQVVCFKMQLLFKLLEYEHVTFDHLKSWSSHLARRKVVANLLSEIADCHVVVQSRKLQLKLYCKQCQPLCIM